MQITQRRINLVILILLIIAITSILSTHFMLQPSEPIVTSTKEPVKVATQKKEDTILSILTAKESGCHTSHIQLNETALMALPQQEFTTNHTWSETADTFRGPLLKDVLELACNNTQTLNLKAINDYSIRMDFTMAQPLEPIVAHTVNGKRLSVREKGPLWVMISTDQHKVAPKSLDAMMIWQLSDITILNADEAS